MSIRRKILLVTLVCVIVVSAMGNTAGAEKELLWMTWGTDVESLMDVLNIRAAEFIKAHPDVKLNTMCAPWADYREKLLVSIAGGVIPDVAVIESPVLAQLVKLGNLEPITDMIRKNPPTGGLEDFAFPNDAVIEGEVYGLQEGGAPYLLIYNVDIFNEAGMPSPTDLWNQRRWTWIDFVEMAKKLTADHNGDGITDQYGFAGFAPVMSAMEAFSYLQYGVYSAGGKIFDKLDFPDQCLLDTPEAKTGIQFLIDVMTNYNIAPSFQMKPSPAAAISFTNNNVAMQMGHPAWAAIYERLLDLPFKFEVSYMPAGPAGLVVPGDSTIDVMFRPVEDKELAYELLRAITEHDSILQVAEEVVWWPARFSILSSQRFKEMYSFDVDVAMDHYKHRVAYPKLFNYFEIGDTLVDELQAAFTGEKTADQVAEDLSKTLNEMLKTAK